MGKNKLLISSLVLLASIFITQNIDAYTTNVLSDTNNYQILEINKEDLQEDATADLVIEDTLKESKKVEEKALIEANKAKNEQNLKTNQKSDECDPIKDPECNKEECDLTNPTDPNCEEFVIQVIQTILIVKVYVIQTIQMILIVRLLNQEKLTLIQLMIGMNLHKSLNS